MERSKWKHPECNFTVFLFEDENNPEGKIYLRYCMSLTQAKNWIIKQSNKLKSIDWKYGEIFDRVNQRDIGSFIRSDNIQII